MTGTHHNTHCRWITQTDLPGVLAIDAATARPGAAWTEDDFFTFMRTRNHIGMVAERWGTVCGYMLYEVGAAHLELHRLAVRPTTQRQGIGTALVAKLAGKVLSHRRECYRATVRETDGAALALLRACEARAVRLRRGHFPDTGEDGIELRWFPTAADWAPWGGPPVNRVAGLLD